MGGSPAGDRRHAVRTAESESHCQAAIGNREDKGQWQKASTEQKKKTTTEVVYRGRQLARVHAKQTKLDFEQRTRDTMPKQTRSDTLDSLGSTSMTRKHAKLTDTGEAGDSTQISTSQPT